MHMRSFVLLFGTAFSMSLTHAAVAGSVTLTVGPGKTYPTISAAVAVADADTSPTDFYIIEVEPGTYTNDFPLVTRPLEIEVDPTEIGRPVILNATVPLPNEKGIILNFSNLIVNGLTFQGAEISSALGGNGAGIRDQNTLSGGGGPGAALPYLIVLNSTFINNQTGMLTGDNYSQSITVTNSKFINNGNPDPTVFQHALYVNYAGSLTVTNSVFCGQLIGHDIKSRALQTNVSDNQLYDGQADAAVGCNAGSTSLAIDVPNGGIAAISGNLITQGQASQNSKMVDYGEEGLLYNTNSFIVSYNNFTNIGTLSAIGIFQELPCVPVQLTADDFTGVATPVYPPSCAVYE